MGGEHYTHTGGGVNYLCLPKTTKYDRYKDGHQGGGYVYGAEYELSFNPFKKSLNERDPPCVVCFVKSRGSMLMMPARNDCPTGWTEEYHGYLMSAHYSHKKQSDFICVDKDADSISGTQANKNGAFTSTLTCGRTVWQLTVWSICHWSRVDLNCVHQVKERMFFLRWISRGKM